MPDPAPVKAQAPNRKSEPAVPVYLFGVVETTAPDGKLLYAPVKVTLVSNQIRQVSVLHEPMPYMALAYNYSQGDLARHYESLTIKHAQEPVREQEGK